MATPSKTELMQRLEQEHGKDIRLLLADHLEQHDTVTEAINALGIDRKTLYNWVDRFGGSMKTRIVFPEPQRD